MPYTNNAASGLLVHSSHIDNLRIFATDGGICCPDDRGPDYREIWAQEIADRRAALALPFGSLRLGSCVAFHFSPLTPAQFGVATGRGTDRFPNREIVHIETSIPDLLTNLIGVAVSDRNLLARDAVVSPGVSGLATVDWPLITGGRFERDASDPTRAARACAEAVVKAFVPLSAVRRILCWDASVAQTVSDIVDHAGIKVETRPAVFFNAGA